MFTLQATVAGADIGSGTTNPTYTLAVDTPPNNNGKQWAVTALGGTQTGVSAHTVSKPFTISVFRPAVPRVLPPANPITGLRKGSPMNTYKVITRKGVNVSSLDNPVVCRVTTTIDVPAGADAYDEKNIAAAITLHFYAIAENLAIGASNGGGLLDTVTSSVL